MTNQESMSNIFQKIERCKKCGSLMPWEQFSIGAHGNINAECMIISEAPGQASIDNQKMWSGTGGKKIRKIAYRVGINLEDKFYMTDIVKCLPPDNRKPRKSEVDSCVPYLTEEIKTLKPKIILIFGQTAWNYFPKGIFSSSDFIPAGTITELHNLRGFKKIEFNNFMVIPLVHPANANIPFKDNYDIYLQHLREAFQLCSGSNKLNPLLQ